MKEERRNRCSAFGWNTWNRWLPRSKWRAKYSQQYRAALVEAGAFDLFDMQTIKVALSNSVTLRL